MSKQVKEWFQQLPDEIRDKAFLNLNSHMAAEECKTLSGALRVGFDWVKSNEGWGFWKNAIEGIYKVERLNEILYN